MSNDDIAVIEPDTKKQIRSLASKSADYSADELEEILQEGTREEKIKALKNIAGKSQTVIAPSLHNKFNEALNSSPDVRNLFYSDVSNVTVYAKKLNNGWISTDEKYWAIALTDNMALMNFRSIDEDAWEFINKQNGTEDYNPDNVFSGVDLSHEYAFDEGMTKSGNSGNDVLILSDDNQTANVFDFDMFEKMVRLGMEGSYSKTYYQGKTIQLGDTFTPGRIDTEDDGIFVIAPKIKNNDLDSVMEILEYYESWDSNLTFLSNNFDSVEEAIEELEGSSLEGLDREDNSDEDYVTASDVRSYVDNSDYRVISEDDEARAMVTARHKDSQADIVIHLSDKSEQGDYIVYDEIVRELADRRKLGQYGELSFEDKEMALRKVRELSQAWDEQYEEPEEEMTRGELQEIEDDVLQVIEDEDDGEGAGYKEIVKELDYSEEEIEKGVNQLLSDGTAYEPRPGKIKKLAKMDSIDMGSEVATVGENFGDMENEKVLNEIVESSEIGGMDVDIKSSGCSNKVFSDKTDLPVFDGPMKNGKGYAFRKVCMKTRDFLRVQASMLGVGLNEFIAGTQDVRLERMREGFEAKENKVPIPVIEFDSAGNMKNFQEGRHRGVVAREKGMRYIPVLLAVKSY